jgi:hypothetical protein
MRAYGLVHGIALSTTSIHAPAHPHDGASQQQEDQRRRRGRGRADGERACAELCARVLDDAPDRDQQLVRNLPARLASQHCVVVGHRPDDFAAQDEVARRLAVLDGQVAGPDRLVVRDALEAPRDAVRALRGHEPADRPVDPEHLPSPYDDGDADRPRFGLLSGRLRW